MAERQDAEDGAEEDVENQRAADGGALEFDDVALVEGLELVVFEAVSVQEPRERRLAVGAHRLDAVVHGGSSGGVVEVVVELVVVTSLPEERNVVRLVGTGRVAVISEL